MFYATKPLKCVLFVFVVFSFCFSQKNYPSVSEPFFCEHTMKASWSKEAVYEPPYFNREEFMYIFDAIFI